MLNEHAGQFYKAVHCKVMRHLKTQGQIGLETDDLALKQNMCRKILVVLVFDVLML